MTAVLVPSPYRLARALRIVLATFFVLVLGLAMAGAGLFLLIRGDANENSWLAGKAENAIRSALGPQLAASFGRTTLAFGATGMVVIASSDVKIARIATGDEVASLELVRIEIGPLSILRGDPRIGNINVQGAVLDASLMPAAAGGLPPADLKGFLAFLADRLDFLGGELASARFSRIRLERISIVGAGLGRIEPDPIEVALFDLQQKSGELVSLDVKAATALSQIGAVGAWKRQTDGGKRLEVRLSGLGASEWAASPLEKSGPVGSDASISLFLSADFDDQGTPLPARLEVAASPGLLRIGEEAMSELKKLDATLVLDPELDALILESSTFAAGEFSSSQTGRVRSLSGDWLRGPFAFTLSGDSLKRTPVLAGEPQVIAAFTAEGGFDPAKRTVKIASVDFLSGDERATANATVVFNGPTPAIRARLDADSLAVSSIKQHWPMFLAPAARKWFFTNVSGGKATQIALVADIPAGVIGRFRRGARMAPEEYELAARFEGVSVRSFGEVPPLVAAAGAYRMKGMEVTATLEKATAAAPGFDPVAVESGTFRIADIGVRPNQAELNLSASGDARSLAAIAESRPLGVMSRIEVEPRTVSGKAHLDLATQFPLKNELAYADVRWNALVELKKAESSSKVMGRSLKDADLLLEANPEQVRVTGEAVVDGNRTRLSMVEPIGGSDVARERSVSAELDEAARKKMGLVLDPVLSGSIKVDLTERAGGTQRQSVVLDDAELSLPWVGWTKGRGIKARATFAMRNEKGITRLDDFYIEGEGFSASGSMALDKNGLKAADFVDISLNARDSFAMKLERKGKAHYTIDVSGLRYDARALLNRLFHQAGYGEEQGGATVLLSARLGEVEGFGGRVLSNVELSYGAKDGWLDHISLRGAFSQSTYMSVQAATTDGETAFEIDTTDAGSALAFTAVYPRMVAGKLRGRLTRKGAGPFVGDVSATSFIVVDEPRIKSLVGNPPADSGQSPSPELRAELERIDANRVRFNEARGTIEKGDGYFRVNNGIINNAQIGFTFDGLVFDKNNRMDLSGTFLPAIGLSRAIGYIPLVGELLGNGRDSGLIGVTYRLTGPSKNPTIEVNPVSVVAPGVFRKVFEFQQN